MANLVKQTVAIIVFSLSATIISSAAPAVPTDSVFGTIKDEAGQELTVQPHVYAKPYFSGVTKETLVTDSSYVLYFEASERGVWWLGVRSEDLVPGYMVPPDTAIDSSSDHSVQHDIVCPKADTTVFVRVTEDGGLPAHAYRVRVTQSLNGYYTEAITGTGASNVILVHVSHLYDTAWYATIVTDDSAHPIPPELMLDGSEAHTFSLGNAITMNFISRKAVTDTVKVDPGDTPPDWDSVSVSLCWIDGCYTAHPDSDGVFTVYGDTGLYSLSLYCPGYLSVPSSRGLHLIHDTTGQLGFVLNRSHCRVSGTLGGAPFPMVEAPPLWISAHTGAGNSGYTAWALVDMVTGTYDLYLGDADWTIDPPSISGFEAPSSAQLTIGESPDTVRTLNFIYPLVLAVGDDGDGLPKSPVLLRNYPNPFNAETIIEYALPSQAHVTIEIFDVLGRRIRILIDEAQSAGRYVTVWNGTDQIGKTVGSGLYLYRISAGAFSRTAKMVLLK